MRGIHAVMEYTGMGMKEVLKLPCDMFMLCRKNWEIDRLMETEAGREYLDDCERYKQTRMDKKGMQRLIARMKGGE